MQAQKRPVPISSFQYWTYHLTHLPPSVLIALNLFFVLVIFLFATKPSKLIEEWYPGGTKPRPTIQVVIPTLAPLPTIPDPPPLPPVASQPEAVAGVYVPEEPAAPVYEEAPTTEMQPTPTVDKEATVDAWLAAPPSTPTPSPASGDPAFGASFQLQPECNVFIGYVGPKRNYCAAVYATQTAEALQ